MVVLFRQKTAYELRISDWRSDVCSSELLGSDDLHEYTQVIIAEADRLASLVDRLIAPQGETLRKTTFNIHELCERVYRLVGAEFPHIEFVRDYDASVPDVNGDLERLLQALLNIVRNAAKALTETPPTGSAQIGRASCRAGVGWYG